MATWSTLKGDEELFIDQLGIKVLGTCKNCKTCSKFCYVNKSYVRYPSVKYGHARNTIGLREAFDKVFSDLDLQLTCQKCGKCFGKNKKMQIIGCKAH